MLMSTLPGPPAPIKAASAAEGPATTPRAKSWGGIGSGLSAEINKTKYNQDLPAHEADKPNYDLNLAVREINERKAMLA